MTNKHTIYAKLLAKQEGQYTQYVFQNLDEPENSWDRYLMVTRCPNWSCPVEMELNTTGYLEFEPVDAGNSYYNPSTGSMEVYKYAAYYFINFIKENTQNNNVKEFKF